MIEVDVNGAAKIREKLPEVISVFIMPPSLKELKRRLVGRGTEDKELVEKNYLFAVILLGSTFVLSAIGFFIYNIICKRYNDTKGNISKRK